MSAAGLWMLLALAVLVVGTGLPVWALLIGTASLFAAGGLLAGVFDFNVLLALTPRLVGLLEMDLLQALPLYVFIGVLLQRLPVADALFATLAGIGRGSPAAPALAGLGVGALIAPMSGSVASTASLLARLVSPRLQHLRPERAVALLSAASTIGVVVPPSLVLILLGDAMLRAHTEASNLPGYTLGATRIVATQDVFNAALLPALLALLAWVAIAAWQARRAKGHVPGALGDAAAEAATAATTAGQKLLAVTTIAVIVLLLVGVFTGKLFAVEAAATGGCLLATLTVVSRALSRSAWREVLLDSLTLSGALFALLVGATTFSLVFRAFGSDRWLSDLVLQSGVSSGLTVFAVLLFIALCAWVLDAFEMIFVIIPILAPALIVRLGDAQQVAVLLLLVLQTSFLLPPVGYAVLMVRSRGGLPWAPTSRIVRALLPFVAAQLLIITLVLLWPRGVHLLDAAAAPASTSAQTEEEVIRRMREMSGAPPADEAK